MDVAKYIGLFLLKNNFVYIHGLGNLELRKKVASYDGENLQGPSYEVAMTQGGSIDDNLANFIATNEQISISKASNALREFSQQSRAELQTGKPVVIPAIGSFVEERNKTTFITNPGFQYTPPPIPSMRVTRRQDETVYTTNADIPVVKPRYIDPDTEAEKSGISWVKIAAWVAILSAVCALGYFGIRYMSNQSNTNEGPLLETPLQDTMAPAGAIPATDIMPTDTSAASGIIADEGLLSFDVVLNTYNDFTKAQRRTDKLKSYGNDVELVAEEDSSSFYVVMPVTGIAPADTTRLLDSLKATFNPTYGVRILE